MTFSNRIYLTVPFFVRVDLREANRKTVALATDSFCAVRSLTDAVAPNFNSK